MADARAPETGAARVALLIVASLALVAALVVVAVVVVRHDDSPTAAHHATTSTPAISTSVPATSVPATSLPPTSVPPSTATAPSTAVVTTVAANPGGDYVAVAPVRLIDTRTGTGVPAGKVGKAPSVTASIVGKTGTAAAVQVKAVALNVTIAEPSQPGYLTVEAAGSKPLEVSQIAFISATASSVIVTKASADGQIDLRLSDGASSHIIVDLLGYFASVRSPDNLSIVPDPQPIALVDTRSGAPIGSGKTVDVTLPTPQAGAVLGITATGAVGPGYLTIYGGSTRPDTSAVNFGAGHDATALSIVATSADRIVHIFNGSSGTVHVVAFQIAGLETGSPPGGLALNIEGTTAQDGRSAPFPFRTVDTRGSSTCQTTLGGGVASVSAIFPKAKALLVSITVTNASMASYLIAYTDSAQPPSVATLNYDAHEVRSNLALVPVSGDRVNLVCGGGNPEYILDVLGTLE